MKISIHFYTTVHALTSIILCQGSPKAIIATQFRIQSILPLTNSYGELTVTIHNIIYDLGLPGMAWQTTEDAGNRNFWIVEMGIADPGIKISLPD